MALQRAMALQREADAIPSTIGGVVAASRYHARDLKCSGLRMAEEVEDAEDFQRQYKIVDWQRLKTIEAHVALHPC